MDLRFSSWIFVCFLFSEKIVYPVTGSIISGAIPASGARSSVRGTIDMARLYPTRKAVAGQLDPFGVDPNRTRVMTAITASSGQPHADAWDSPHWLDPLKQPGSSASRRLCGEICFALASSSLLPNYGARLAVYALMLIRSSSVSFATTGFIRSAQSPWRGPVCMSNSCRAL